MATAEAIVVLDFHISYAQYATEYRDTHDFIRRHPKRVLAYGRNYDEARLNAILKAPQPKVRKIKYR